MREQFFHWKKEGFRQDCSVFFFQQFGLRNGFLRRGLKTAVYYLFLYIYIFFLKVVWKDSRNKTFVYDMSDIRKESIKTIIQMEGWHRVKSTGLACWFHNHISDSFPWYRPKRRERMSRENLINNWRRSCFSGAKLVTNSTDLSTEVVWKLSRKFSRRKNNNIWLAKKTAGSVVQLFGSGAFKNLWGEEGGLGFLH